MIKFFRKIRQRLLSENKFSKYLIYAIGEIILVVIGILIALGINNWNENSKNNDEEKIILINLNKDLKTDSIQFTYYEEQFKEIDQLHLDLFKLAHDSIVLDSISEPILLRRLLFFEQLVDMDLKDNLKKIANPKINNALINYLISVQDMEMIYHSHVTPLIRDQLKPLLAENNIYNVNNWFSIKNRSFKDKTFKAMNGKNLIDKNKLLILVKRDAFQQLLVDLNAKWNDFYARLNIVIENNYKLRKLIKTELKDH